MWKELVRVFEYNLAAKLFGGILFVLYSIFEGTSLGTRTKYDFQISEQNKLTEEGSG